MAFNTAPGRAEYTASAAQTKFTFAFKIFNTSDMKVYLTPAGQTADDTADILIETTDYTITINGDNGGDVDLTSGATLNDSVTLVRSLPITRDTEYQHAGDLTAAALNSDQEYQTYLTLDASVDFERSIKVPTSVQSFNTEIPSPIANKLLVFNNAADGFNLLDTSSTGFFNDAFIVESVAAMTGVDPNLYGSVIARGYYVANDGGGGLFNYDATQSAVNNGGTIIDGWVRQYGGAINVRWFGAKGDDATDNTSVFAAMVLLGKDIFVDDGIYLGYFDLDGISNIRISGVKNSTIKNIDSSVFPVINIKNNSNIILENLNLDGNESNQTAGTHGVRLENCDNITIQNIKISDTRGYGIGAQVAPITNLLVDNIQMFNIGNDGIDFKNIGGTHKNIEISNINIEGFATFPGNINKAGIDVRGHVNITNVSVDYSTSPNAGIAGIRFREFGATTGIGGKLSNISNVKVIGNNDAGSFGFYCANNDINVNNIIVEDVGIGALLLGSRINFTNGSIFNSDSGIYTQANPINGAIYNVNISNIHLLNLSSRGFRIRTDSNNVIIKGVTFDTISSDELLIEGNADGILISNNAFNQTPTVGITSTGAVLAKNNLGMKNEGVFTSSSVLVDAVASIQVDIPHDLFATPNIDDVMCSIIRETAVNDFAIAFVGVGAVTSTTISCFYRVTVASATPGATIKVVASVDGTKLN